MYAIVKWMVDTRTWYKILSLLLNPHIQAFYVRLTGTRTTMMKIHKHTWNGAHICRIQKDLKRKRNRHVNHNRTFLLSALRLKLASSLLFFISLVSLFFISLIHFFLFIASSSTFYQSPTFFFCRFPFISYTMLYLLRILSSQRYFFFSLSAFFIVLYSLVTIKRQKYHIHTCICSNLYLSTALYNTLKNASPFFCIPIHLVFFMIEFLLMTSLCRWRCILHIPFLRCNFFSCLLYSDSLFIESMRGEREQKLLTFDRNPKERTTRFWLFFTPLPSFHPNWFDESIWFFQFVFSTPNWKRFSCLCEFDRPDFYDLLMC